MPVEAMADAVLPRPVSNLSLNSRAMMRLRCLGLAERMARINGYDLG